MLNLCCFFSQFTCKYPLNLQFILAFSACPFSFKWREERGSGHGDMQLIACGPCTPRSSIPSPPRSRCKIIAIIKHAGRGPLVSRPTSFRLPFVPSQRGQFYLNNHTCRVAPNQTPRVVSNLPIFPSHRAMCQRSVSEKKCFLLFLHCGPISLTLSLFRHSPESLAASTASMPTVHRPRWGISSGRWFSLRTRSPPVVTWALLVRRPTRSVQLKSQSTQKNMGKA